MAHDISQVKAVVDKLDDEFITVDEFKAISNPGQGGARYQISDSASSIATLLGNSLHSSISVIVPSNGAKLQLGVTEITNLFNADQVNNKNRLFSGFIDLTASFVELKGIQPGALDLATSYVLSDTPDQSGGITFEDILVKEAVVVGNASNSSDYLYSLKDNAQLVTAQDIDTVNAIKNSSAIEITGTASILQIRNLDSNYDLTKVDYNITDSTSDALLGSSRDAIFNANTLNLSTLASVSEVETIVSSQGISLSKVNFGLDDKGTNLAATSAQAEVAKASSVKVNDYVTIENLNIINGYFAGGVPTYNVISDNSTNLLAAIEAVKSGAQAWIGSGVLLNLHDQTSVDTTNKLLATGTKFIGSQMGVLDSPTALAQVSNETFALWDSKDVYWIATTGSNAAAKTLDEIHASRMLDAGLGLRDGFPVAPISLADNNINLVSDSGSRDDDNYTNVSKPTVSFTLSDAESKLTLAGQTIEVIDTSDSNKVVGQHVITQSEAADVKANGTINAGTKLYSIALSSSLDHGLHKLALRVKPTLTRSTMGEMSGTSVINSGGSITIDTLVSAPTVSLVDDSGAAAFGGSNTDKYTYNAQLKVSGLEPGAVAQYRRISPVETPWGSSQPGAHEGVNTYEVRQIDLAGNISSATTFTFEKDTTISTGNEVVADLLGGSDSGVSPTDNLTNEVESEVTVTFNKAKARVGDTIRLSRSDNPTSAQATVGNYVLKSTDIGPNAPGIITFKLARGALKEGNNVLMGRHFDKANNWQPVSTYVTVDFDTTVSAANEVTLDLVAATDTGASNTDNLTQTAASKVEVAFNKDNAEVGDKITLKKGSKVFETITLDSTTRAAGKVTFTLDTGDLAEGDNVLTAVQSDAAGNTVTGDTSLKVDFDTTVSAANEVTLDLVAATDTGASNTDNLTQTAASKVEVAFNKDNAEVGDKITLKKGSKVFETITLDSTTRAAGKVTFTLDTGDLAEGDNVLTAVQSDAAGNTVTGDTSLKVDFDTTVSAANEVTLDLVAATDTGASNTDNLTQTAASKVEVAFNKDNAEVGDKITLKKGSKVFETITLDSTTRAAGKVTFTLDTGDLAEGDNVLTAVQSDAAGNTVTGDTSLKVDFDTTVSAANEVTLDLVAATDTGASNTDNLTQTAASKVEVAFNKDNAEVGDKITLKKGSKVFETITLDSTTRAAGKVTFTLDTGDLAEGDNVLTAVQSDAAGNTVTGDTSLKVDFDTTVSAANEVTLDLVAATDTGASNTDNLTQTAASKVEVAFNKDNAEVGDKITLKKGSKVFETITLDSTTRAAGKVTFTLDTGDLAEGDNVLTAVQSDAAGNTVTGDTSLKVDFDTTVSAANEVTLDLVAATDTGASNTDNLTQTAASKVEVAFNKDNAEVGDKITLKKGSKVFETITLDSTTRAAGKVTFTLDTGDLAEGDNVLTAVQSDAAGNTVTGDTSLKVDFDTTVSAANEVTLDLVAATDTGASNTDNLTQTAASKVEVAFNKDNAEVGDKITLKKGSKVFETITLDSTTRAAGKVTFTLDTGDLAEGDNVLTAVQSDAAGNTVTGDTSLKVDFDTTVSAANEVTLDLVAATDTGASNTDNLTQTAASKVEVAFNKDNAEVGDKITLKKGSKVFETITLDSTTRAAGKVTFTLDTGDLAEGDNVLTAVQSDAAGNTVTGDTSLKVDFDTTVSAANEVTLDLVAATDTGASNTDNLTQTAASKVEVAFNKDNAEVGDKITLKKGSKVFETITLDSTTRAAGKVTFTLDTGDLAEGDNVLTAVQSDAAGNTVTGDTSLKVDFDTTVSAANEVTLDLVAATDTGASNTDNLTQTAASKVEVAFNKDNAEVGDKITLKKGSKVFETITLDSTTRAAGKVTFTLDTGDLAEGDNVLTAVQSDAAGNTVTGDTSLKVDFDTTVSAANEVTLDLVAATDTGASNTDNLTQTAASKVEVAFNKDNAEVGDKITLKKGSKVFETITLDSTTRAAGKVTFTLDTGDLAEGDNVLTAVQSDAAGNTVTGDTSLKVDFDTTVSAANEVTLDLVAATDTGASNTDNLTQTAASKVEVAFNKDNAEVGDKITLKKGSKVFETITLDSTTRAAGKVTFTLDTGDLAEGDNVLTAVQSDAAGNTVTGDTSLKVDFDTTVSAANEVTLDLVAATDTGASNTDNLTQTAASKVEVAFNKDNAEVGDKITLKKGSKVFETITLDSTTRAAGKVTFTLDTGDLAEGDNVLTAVQSDAAGNTVTAKSSLTINYDTIAPTDPTLSLYSVQGGAKKPNGDMIIADTRNTAKVVFSYTGNDLNSSEETFQYSVNDGSSWVNVSSIDATKNQVVIDSLDVSAPTTTILVRATDFAGNATSTLLTKTITQVDTTSASYALTDIASNINSADQALLKGATALTATDDTTTSGSVLDLDNTKIDALGNISDIAITGDAGVNIVELSTVLTDSKTAEISFGGASEDSVDTLIFNTADSSSYTSYAGGGARAGGPETFAFNKITGMDLANSGTAEDKLGVFYGETSLIRNSVSIDVTVNSFAVRLKDGLLYEDLLAGTITQAQAKSVTHIQTAIAELVEFGNTAVSSKESDGVGKEGAIDFVYVTYGQSQADVSVTSAYVYSGYYEDTEIAKGAGIDNSKFKISSLAEIVGVSNGELDTASLAGIAQVKPTELG